MGNEVSVQPIIIGGKDVLTRNRYKDPEEVIN